MTSHKTCVNDSRHLIALSIFQLTNESEAGKLTMLVFHPAQKLV